MPTKTMGFMRNIRTPILQLFARFEDGEAAIIMQRRYVAFLGDQLLEEHVAQMTADIACREELQVLLVNVSWHTQTCPTDRPIGVL